MGEIEKFFDDNPVFGTVIVFIALMGMVGIIFIGRSFTPKSGEILTPQNWQIMNSRKAYEQELNDLKSLALELVELLNTGQPDPIQGQVVTDSVMKQMNQLSESGHAALHRERAAVRNAAVAVRDWSQGAMFFENAQIFVNDAIDLLKSAEIQ